jgi:DNA-binding response OmpR family regulator
MSERTGRVYFVDDARQARVVRALDNAGYVVRTAGSGEPHEREVAAFEADVVVARFGPEVRASVAALRRHGRRRVIFVVARGVPREARLEARRIADDLFTEPFDVDELIARIDGLMDDQRARPLVVDDLSIDRAGQVVRRDGVQLALTTTEYRLLLELVAHAGRVLSKRDLLGAVWGYDGSDVNVVEVHISALRRKLEANGSRLVHTVRGGGYVVRPAEPLGGPSDRPGVPAILRTP